MRKNLQIPKFGSNKEFLLPGVLILLVIISLAGAFPLFSHIAKNREEAERLLGEVTTMSTKKEQLGRVQVGNVQQQVNLLTRVLPNKPGILSAVSRIQDVAKERGIAVLQMRIEIGDEEKMDSVPNVEIKMEIEGQPSNIQFFVEDVEQSLPFMQVTSGKLSVTGGITKVTLIIRSFWKGIPDKLPDATNPLPTLSQGEQELISRLQTFKERRIAAFAQTVTEPTPLESRPNPFSF